MLMMSSGVILHINYLYLVESEEIRMVGTEGYLSKGLISVLKSHKSLRNYPVI
jgi:hypothetical protein